MKNLLHIFLISNLLLGCGSPRPELDKRQPNILFIITDDQSWEHVGVYGDKAVRTPAFDDLARGGVKFTNAYCAAPSCSPSRAGILTGQDIYRLEEGGVLTGYIRDKFDVFPLILEQNGYTIGNTGKPYWPVTKNVEGAHNAPIGKRYTEIKIDAPKGISKTDYAANFDQFLEEKPKDQPFFFWVGTGEPHLPHPTGLGLETGLDTAQIRIPGFYEDASEIRLALSDYMAEIEWADKMVARILKSLKDKGLLENTLIVLTSDNGMPFPRAKATLYDHGVRMPLIISWDKKIKAGRVIDDPVSLTDLAPTFLEYANLPVPEMMTGRSLNNLLISDKSGKIDAKREFVVSSFEVHTLARPDSLGYPRRALHTDEWTYIRNYEPDRYPAGNRETYIPRWDNYGDVDPSAIKTYFKENESRPDFNPIYEMSFGKVPDEELFNKNNDPDMMNNLAGYPEFQSKLKELRIKLENYLIENEDPRMKGLSPWDHYYLDTSPPVKKKKKID